MFRCLWPAEALAARGYDVHAYPPGHAKRIQASLKQWPNGSEHVHRVVDVEADVCVFQRPLSRIMGEAMIELQRNGVEVVVELDDDFRAVSPRNHAFALVHPARSPESNWRWLDKVLEHCDRLVCTTPNLAKRYGRYCDTSVVANYVPARFLDVEVPRPATTTLGWAGAVLTHPDDVQVAARGTRDALRATGARFRAIGPPNGVSRALGIADIEATGWVPIEDYPKSVAAIDVGIAPLEDSTFNKSKSWLKPLEYAALGVPFVMSPREDYVRLHNLGIGRLAEKPGEWKWHLRQLLADPELRAKEAAANRALVRTLGLTIEDRCEEWWAAWTGEHQVDN